MVRCNDAAAQRQPSNDCWEDRKESKDGGQEKFMYEAPSALKVITFSHSMDCWHADRQKYMHARGGPST